MRAITYARHGGPEVMTWDEVAVPTCHRKGILIGVEAVSVEGGDLLDRSGNFAPLAAEPLIIGRQAAGVILEVGDDAPGFKVGQRAVGVRPNGSHAEIFAAPARTSWLIPQALSTEMAAALPIAFATAHDALHHYGRLQAGETVLIQAGASGVGIAAIQLARTAGAGLILATGSSDERLARLRAFGLDHGINYRTANLAEEVARLTSGRGVDVLLETVGGDSMQASIDSMARGGRLVAIGQASRAPVLVDLKQIYARGIILSGFRLDIASDRIHGAVTAILAQAARGEVEVVLDRTFSLEDTAAAHAYVESRAAFGRVILHT